MEFKERLDRDEAAGILPHQYRKAIEQFYLSYLDARSKAECPEMDTDHLFDQFLRLLEEECADPYQFEPYHRMVREGKDDYHKFGRDVFMGIVTPEGCQRIGFEHLAKVEEQLANKENVVFLANHQTEGDPQVVSLLLDEGHHELGRDMIFVAGERVLIDPMAIPFSKGCNLLCVYSKKYIDTPPEKRAEKVGHNQRTMKALGELLSEGGHAIYVAPSGGRDRLNEEGYPVVAPFDAPAIEMFRLISRMSKRPCHFYPMALGTYNILPPPHDTIEEGWEPRYTKGGPVHIAFGPEIDMNSYPGSEEKDKQKRRQALADHCWNLVNDLYQQLPTAKQKQC